METQAILSLEVRIESLEGLKDSFEKLLSQKEGVKQNCDMGTIDWGISNGSVRYYEAQIQRLEEEIRFLKNTLSAIKVEA